MRALRVSRSKWVRCMVFLNFLGFPNVSSMCFPVSISVILLLEIRIRDPVFISCSVKRIIMRKKKI